MTEECSMADDRDNIAALAATDEGRAFVQQVGQWCAEQVLDDCIRYHVDLRRYSRAAVVRRADKDVTGDLAQNAALGFTCTSEEATIYRDHYIAGFVACWFDEAVRRRLREKYSGNGFIIVC